MRDFLFVVVFFDVEIKRKKKRKKEEEVPRSLHIGENKQTSQNFHCSGSVVLRRKKTLGRI